VIYLLKLNRRGEITIISKPVSRRSEKINRLIVPVNSSGLKKTLRKKKDVINEVCT